MYLRKNTHLSSSNSTECSGDSQDDKHLGMISQSNNEKEEDQHQPLVYFFMPRYGQNLQEILEERNDYLSNASIFHLGLNLLNILELIHRSGLVYNDLKPDNILIGYG